MSYAIVSRDFWPNAAAIGDGLMCLSRKLSKIDQVSVVTMSRQNLAELDRVEAGVSASKIQFRLAKPLTDSSSGVSMRIFELIYFSFWVAISLVRGRPSVVYVATNPPLLVPFIVSIYCKLFRKEYVYHVQDIHPEATSLLIKLPRFIFSALQSIDTWVLNGASKIVTLTDDMRKTLLKRGVNKNNIILLENPSLVYKGGLENKVNGIVFSGNAGRLQLMDIVLAAIEEYIQQGGRLLFCFVGSGVYKGRLQELSDQYETFSYRGYVDGNTALKIASGYRWALLPIMPEVLSYAYPSKIPAYISAGCEVISITNGESSLAKWVEESGMGHNIEPSVSMLLNYLKSLEKKQDKDDIISKATFSTPDDFAFKLQMTLKGNR